MELKGKKINFLGDSITYGHGTSSPDKRFSDLIAKNEGAVVRNYGINGTTVAFDPTKAVGQSFCERVSSMDPDADIIVIFGGTNDFCHGSAAIGNMSDREYNTFYGGLHTLFREVVEKYPDSVICMLTPLHRCEQINVRGEALKQFVQIIREVAEYYSLPLLDLYKTYGVQPEIPVMKEKYINLIY